MKSFVTENCSLYLLVSGITWLNKYNTELFLTQTFFLFASTLNYKFGCLVDNFLWIMR